MDLQGLVDGTHNVILNSRIPNWKTSVTVTASQYRFLQNIMYEDMNWKVWVETHPWETFLFVQHTLWQFQ